MLVGREVRRHPVEDHADAVLVQRVDEVHEVLRRAVAAGRREVAGRLVAPRAVERVLHDRQELDVGEAHLAARTRPAAAPARGSVSERLPSSGHAAPRAEVHLVDRRSARRARCARGALRHPRRRRPTRSRGPRRPTPVLRRHLVRGRRTGRPCRRGSRRSARRCGTCRARPAPTPGTKPSQMPEIAARRERVAAACPSR